MRASSRRRIICTLLAGVSLLSGSGLALAGSPHAEANISSAPAEVRDVTILLSSDMTNIDPQAGNGEWFVVLHQNVSESLVRLGPDGDVEPVLAESWELVNPGTYRIQLREGVTFQNGEPFDAAAVVYSLGRFVSPDITNAISGYLDGYTGATAVDDLTVDVTFETGPVGFLSALSFVRIAPPEYTDGEDHNELLIGTGPYRMVEKSTESIVLEHNLDYWGELTGPARVTLVSRPDEAARVAALQAGDADVITGVPPQSIHLVPKTISAPSSEVNLFVLNGASAVLSDPLLREAVVKSVDVDSVLEAILPGLASPAECQFGRQGIEGYNPDLAAPTYDPEGAAALLEEAGYDGTPLRIVVSQGRWYGSDLVGQIVASSLEQTGFEVDLQIVTLQEQFELTRDMPNEQKPDMWYTAPDVTFSVRQPWGGFTYTDAPGGSFPPIENFDEHLRAAAAETDAAAAEAQLNDIATQICDNHAFLFLYWPDLVFGLAGDLDFPAQSLEIPFAKITVA